MKKNIDLLVCESLELALMLAVAVNTNTLARLSIGKTSLFSPLASFSTFTFLTWTCVDNKQTWLSV